ncbi:hypothetical protein LX16_3406 [Stackebrandtia albiflava]|uniref:Uncharacterized protein n=1 Tax=Stackebrandtia albiflava TaxID=406432 RepID=A0A562V431_9ACTN|nr:hypothetical protein [Stackebrandtia albiflava]TWJ12644.1 hypothetical protein LX16_3406 [Stackebrandtia albiflava]
MAVRDQDGWVVGTCDWCGRTERDVVIGPARRPGGSVCTDRLLFGRCPAPAEWTYDEYVLDPDHLLSEAMAASIDARWRELNHLVDFAHRHRVHCPCVKGGPDRGSVCRFCGEYVPITTGH